MELNKCFFSGYAVSGVKMNVLANGGYVGEFSIGINDPVYTKEDGTKTTEHCNFVKIAVYGNFAVALLKMIAKGTPIVCECHLRQKVWESNGKKHYDILFIADTVKVLPKKVAEQNKPSEFSNQTENPVAYSWTPQEEKTNIPVEDGLF